MSFRKRWLLWRFRRRTSHLVREDPKLLEEKILDIRPRLFSRTGELREFDTNLSVRLGTLNEYLFILERICKTDDPNDPNLPLLGELSQVSAFAFFKDCDGKTTLEENILSFKSNLLDLQAKYRGVSLTDTGEVAVKFRKLYPFLTSCRDLASQLWSYQYEEDE